MAWLMRRPLAKDLLIRERHRREAGRQAQPRAWSLQKARPPNQPENRNLPISKENK